MPPASSDLLTSLRTATAPAHRELEDQIDIPQLCTSREGYIRLLEDFLGFVEPLEEALQKIEGWEGVGFHWSERAKTHLLREDLLALGHSAATLRDLPRTPDVPRPQDLAEAFGPAYVMEGSTLGGRRIVEILAQSNIPETAQHYFSSYGERVGSRWREFCAMLTQFSSSDSERIVPLASATFSQLGHWLQRPR